MALLVEFGSYSSGSVARGCLGWHVSAYGLPGYSHIEFTGDDTLGPFGITVSERGRGRGCVYLLSLYRVSSE